MDFEHIPVLFNETVNSLEIKPDGLYVDCTAGGGGHSHAVAQRLSDKGRLIAIDRDPEAIEVLKARFAPFPYRTGLGCLDCIPLLYARP